MISIAIILAAVALFLWVGIGVTVLLFREAAPYRIPVIPAMGMCAGILFTLFLGNFSLSGQTIAIVTLVFFGLLNLVALYRCRLTRQEGRSSLLVLLCCLVGFFVYAWPIVVQGYDHYWGFANPDHALYVPIIEYLEKYSFGIAPTEFLPTVRALQDDTVFGIGYDSSVILGVSYFLSILSLLTGAPIVSLFSVLTAAVAMTVPASVFVLCQLGLRLPYRTSVAAALLAACSSLVAYTLHLHSLGTMTVIALLPVGVAVILHYLRDPRLRNLPAPVLIVAGMYYNYFPGFAMLAIGGGTAVVVGVMRNPRQFVPALLVGAGTAVSLLAISYDHAKAILHRLLYESLTDRLMSRTDELLAPFALVLTERGAAFFWGLHLPYIAPMPLFGIQTAGFWLYFVAACLLFACLMLAAFRWLSGVIVEYSVSLALFLLLLLYYALTANGYGAFKVVAFIHGIVLAGFTASVAGLWRWCGSKGSRILRLVPVVALACYVAPNLANAIKLGGHSFGGRAASLSNAGLLGLDDFRELESVAKQWGPSGILLALPDTVSQQWALPFLRGAVVRRFPLIALNVVDSSPRPEAQPLREEFVLHWGEPELDVIPVASSGAVWRGERLALTPVAQCRELLTLGHGWYRAERVNDSPLDWQRTFRWLRRRGEILVLNPSREPRRLLLRLIAGPGNPSPDRRVEFYLNGSKFDEIDFTGQTRIVTRPFVASGPWSQIEVAVVETSEPIPRAVALWNRWVPHDARRLNVAVSELTLIGADEATGVVTSAIEFGVGKRFLGLADGVHPDGWASANVHMKLRAAQPVAGLEISGMLHGVKVLPSPYPVKVTLNGTVLETVIEHPGRFNLRLPLSHVGIKPGEIVTVRLGPLATFSGESAGISRDPRRVAFILERVELVGTETDNAGDRKAP